MKLAASLSVLAVAGLCLPAAAQTATVVTPQTITLNKECQELYDAYQTAESPKAFATGPAEACGWAFDASQTIEHARAEALKSCQEFSEGAACAVVMEEE